MLPSTMNTLKSAFPMLLPKSKLLANTALRSMSSIPNLEFVKAEKVGTDGRVGLLTLNRPKALNALFTPLMNDLLAAIQYFESDKTVGAMVLTGSEKAFAAGADIKEMQNRTFAANYQENFLNFWGDVAKTKKPIIAAVNGYALGGGAELAMMCDIYIIFLKLNKVST